MIPICRFLSIRLKRLWLHWPSWLPGERLLWRLQLRLKAAWLTRAEESDPWLG